MWSPKLLSRAGRTRLWGLLALKVTWQHGNGTMNQRLHKNLKDQRKPREAINILLEDAQYIQCSIPFVVALMQVLKLYG
jgi:hypothetical protein